MKYHRLALERLARVSRTKYQAESIQRELERIGKQMGDETLQEKIRRRGADPNDSFTVFASDVVELLDERDSRAAALITGIKAALADLTTQFGIVYGGLPAPVESAMQILQKALDGNLLPDLAWREARDKWINAQEFHPRAMHLIEERRNFIVIAEDEKYFEDAYDTIRVDQIMMGNWTEEDQAIYEGAIKRARSL